MSRAEYMRNYRALRKINEANSEEIADTASTIAVLQRQKIEALEAEVKHLKAELATRSPSSDLGPYLQASFGAPHPAPKPTKHR